MFYLKDGDIVPGVGIGKLTLDMTFEEVTALFKKFKLNDLDVAWKIEAGDVQVWVDKAKNKVDQILVNNGFKGKYAQRIGLGSTLGEVKKLLGKSWYEYLDVYYLEGEPNMCLDLDFDVIAEDNDDDWDEAELPIDYFAVFSGGVDHSEDQD